MADRDTFFAQCEQCKPGTVGWLIAQLVDSAAAEYAPGLQSIVVEEAVHFGAGDANPNLAVASIGKGEDGSICIELTDMSRPRTEIADAEGLDFEPDESYTVSDMANVGYSLMQTIKRNCPDYSWSESPAEIVCDLINERDEATAIPDGMVVVSESLVRFVNDCAQMRGTMVEGNALAARANSLIAAAPGSAEGDRG